MARRTSALAWLTWLLLGLPPVLFAIAIWLPFGFSLGGLVEEWGILYVFAINQVFYFLDPSSAMPGQSMRPLTILPHAIAYGLDSSSFRYWHVLLWTSLVIKGISGGVVGRYISRSLFIGVLVGLLTMSYPADTMQLSLRVIHLNWAVALVLLSIPVALTALHTKSRVLRFLLTIAAVLAFVAGSLMYEVVISLFALPFMILFARYGGTVTLSILRRRLDVLALWLSGPMFCAIYMIWIARTIRTYQMDVVGPLGWHLIFDPRRWEALIQALYRAFIEAWIDVASFTILELSSFVYPVVIAFILCCLLFFLLCWETRTPLKVKWQFGRMATVGLTAFILGYLPFLTSLSHTYLTQRTYLASALGAALTVGALIWWFQNTIGHRGAAVAAAILLSLAFVGQLYQFDRYNRIYAEVARPILVAATRVVDSTPANSTAVLVNEFGYLSGTFDLGAFVDSGVSYLLGRPVSLVVCEAHTDRKLPRRVGPPHQRGSCIISAGRVTVREADKEYDIDRPKVWRLAPDGSLSTASTSLLEKADTERLSRMLAPSTWRVQDSLFQSNKARPSTYQCKFDSMWGFAYPCRTFGFFEAEAFRDGLFTTSAAWIGETRAGWIFELVPDSIDYLISIRVHDWWGPSRQIELLVNGSLVHHEWQNSNSLRASVTPNALISGINTLEIRSSLHEQYGLSGLIVGVEIKPIDPTSTD